MQKILDCEQLIFDLVFKYVSESVQITKFDKKLTVDTVSADTYGTVSYTATLDNRTFAYIHTYHSTPTKLEDTWSFTHTKPNGISDVTSAFTPILENRGTEWTARLIMLAEVKDIDPNGYSDKLRESAVEIANKIIEACEAE